MRNLLTALLGIYATGCMAESSADPADSEATTQALDATASAAHNDSFTVHTTDSGGYGAAEFVDHGPDGDGDDYIVIHDLCSDGHGVKAYAWINGIYLGGMYNGNGLAGAPVIWDPFGDVSGGQNVGLKVCLVDGDGDPTASSCGSATVKSVDG
jgi:hypothetical protein